MIQSLLRAMELLELLKEANHKYSIAELSESHQYHIDVMQFT